jgi:hypothetical protein
LAYYRSTKHIGGFSIPLGVDRCHVDHDFSLDQIVQSKRTNTAAICVGHAAFSHTSKLTNTSRA